MKKILLPLLLAVMLVSCGSDDNKINTGLVNNPASATESSNTKEPKIEFAVMEHDFGKIIQGEQMSFTYKFKNTGNAPLIISAVEKTCGCTDTKFPREPIKPGEEGSISITYDSKGHKGFQNKRIIVKANTNPSETILKFKAQVQTVDNF
ncbi:MAG: DUF1573 domain-containing protein [Bacteroidales bacterium]|jgi:hypothetical protein|nr:DUF1573 domain-containing protein [Bacteroidales bacterium]